jgi:hypothetical protein
MFINRALDAVMKPLLYSFYFFNAKQPIGLNHQNQHHHHKGKNFVDSRDIGIQISG